jgi:hypothetical protein
MVSPFSSFLKKKKKKEQIKKFTELCYSESILTITRTTKVSSRAGTSFSPNRGLGG